MNAKAKKKKLDEELIQQAIEEERRIRKAFKDKDQQLINKYTCISFKFLFSFAMIVFVL